MRGGSARFRHEVLPILDASHDATLGTASYGTATEVPAASLITWTSCMPTREHPDHADADSYSSGIPLRGRGGTFAAGETRQ
ncbi:hypothetical protein Sm713_08900 [Streptomyces sp. TS71-3]|nr:hypothetical protein Sm713_08900 [Streptomyces sp. TS71-3]